VECWGGACFVFVRILLCGNGLKHRSEITEVEVRHWEFLLLQGLMYASGRVNWRGYIMLMLFVMERIGGWMGTCRVLVQEGVEFML